MGGAAVELARVGRSTDAFALGRFDDFVVNPTNGWILQRFGGPLEAIEPAGTVLTYDLARLPEGDWRPLPPQAGIVPPLQYERRGPRLLLRWTDGGAGPATPPALVASPPTAVPTPRAPAATPPPAPSRPAPTGPEVRVTPLPLVSGSAAAVLTRGAEGTLVAATTTIDGAGQVGAVVDLAGGAGFGDHLGRAFFALGAGDSTVTALAADGDGRVTVGGHVTSSTAARHTGVVARLTAAGLLDGTFGAGGLVALGPEHAEVADVAVLPTGETLVLTRLRGEDDRRGAALVLLDRSGAPVAGFGRAEGAVALTGPAGCALDLDVLRHDPGTGRSYAGGSLADRSGRRPVVLAFDEHGGFDPTFADGGMLTTAFHDRGGAVAGLSLVRGRDAPDLVAAGRATGPGGERAALARITAAGQLRAGFGDAGVCTLDADDDAGLVGATVRSRRGLLAVGTRGRGADRQLIVAEVDTEGRPSPAGVLAIGPTGVAVAAVGATATGAVVAVTVPTDSGPVPHVVTIG